MDPGELRRTEQVVRTGGGTERPGVYRRGERIWQGRKARRLADESPSMGGRPGGRDVESSDSLRAGGGSRRGGGEKRSRKSGVEWSRAEWSEAEWSIVE